MINATSTSPFNALAQSIATKVTNAANAGTLTIPTTGLADAISTIASSGVTASSLQSLANQSVAALSTNAKNTLKKSPFAPKDVNLFTPAVYTSATPTAPAAANTKTEAQLRNDLKSMFNTRFCYNSSQVNKGLAVFDDATLKAKVPDARMRAAVASLYGTYGEGAIDSIKKGDFKAVKFGSVPGAGIIGMTQIAAGDTKPTITINDAYKYEDPRLIGETLSHEVLHADGTVTAKEEMIAYSLESALYGQMVKEDPSLARSGTELARRLNTRLMALVNSRDANGNIRILTSTGNVYPGGATPLSSFSGVFPDAMTSADTTGNKQLAAFLSKVTKQNVSSANFDTATVNKIDQGINKAFSSCDWVAIANALKLNTAA